MADSQAKRRKREQHNSETIRQMHAAQIYVEGQVGAWALNSRSDTG